MTSMDPRLLRAARRGDCAGLEALLLGAAAAASAAPSQVAIDVLVHHHGGAASGQQAPEAAPLLLDAAATTPQGDSALHVVAASGDGEAFLRCARTIYRHAARLLDRPNARGDTPLHCAARAGNAAMVRCLLDMARQEEELAAGAVLRVADVLEKQNSRQETALHDAVRLGDEQLVGHLMSVHPRVARLPRPGGDGMSPLYLAVSLGHDRIAELLHQQGDELSYSGPAGQTALHAAVLRGAEMTEKILEWNKGLAGEADASGSTALHFAAAKAENPEIYSSSLLRRCLRRSPWSSSRGRRSSTLLLLEADPSLPFRPDSGGEYPIHVAAAVGNLRLVALLLDGCPECASLRDARGRTFVHVAVDRGRQEIVEFAVDKRRFLAAAILNAQDDDGNTALHLAVVVGVLTVFWCLLRNREVRLDLANDDGLTPVDLARSAIPAGLYYKANARTWILWSLVESNALGSTIRRDDHFEEKYVPKLDESVESKKMTESTQMLGVGSVLVAAVTFAVAFSPPGGYGSDGGGAPAPALAGQYIFDAFMYAVAIAFAYSMLATFNLIYAGTAAVDRKIRRGYLERSLSWMRKSTRSLLVAFALGVYLVLASRRVSSSGGGATAAGVCAIAAGTLFLRNREVPRMLMCAYALQKRMGIMVFARIGVPMAAVLLQSGIVFVVIFGAPLWTPLCLLVFVERLVQKDVLSMIYLNRTGIPLPFQ